MKAENYYLKFTFYQMRQIVFLYILRHKFENLAIKFVFLRELIFANLS